MNASLTTTPEFLCWAIERQCPLREMLPENQPEKVERHLRAARFTAEAIAEGRVRDDLATSADGSLAFRVSEQLVIYGGESVLRECCSTCSANALATMRQPSYAGCYGLFPLPQPSESFLARVQKFERNNQLFPPSQLLWYGWWMQSPLNAKQMSYLANVFSTLQSEPVLAADPALLELATALRLCDERGLHLSVQLFPAGEIDGLWWNQLPHCGVCQAAWQIDSKLCVMCGQSRHPASPKKRRVRGTRPYRPISELPLPGTRRTPR